MEGEQMDPKIELNWTEKDLLWETRYKRHSQNAGEDFLEFSGTQPP